MEEVSSISDEEEVGVVCKDETNAVIGYSGKS
jgi:hypothetical protein